MGDPHTPSETSSPDIRKLAGNQLLLLEYASLMTRTQRAFSVGQLSARYPFATHVFREQNVATIAKELCSRGFMEAVGEDAYRVPKTVDRILETERPWQPYLRAVSGPNPERDSARELRAVGHAAGERSSSLLVLLRVSLRPRERWEAIVRLSSFFNRVAAEERPISELSGAYWWALELEPRVTLAIQTE